MEGNAGDNDDKETVLKVSETGDSGTASFQVKGNENEANVTMRDTMHVRDDFGDQDVSKDNDNREIETIQNAVATINILELNMSETADNMQDNSDGVNITGRNAMYVGDDFGNQDISEDEDNRDISDEIIHDDAGSLLRRFGI